MIEEKQRYYRNNGDNWPFKFNKLGDFITECNKLRTDDPYNEVIEIYKTKYPYNCFVALVYTTVLGFDTVYCEYNGDKDRFEWATDWYEGGECHLIAICPLDEVKFWFSQVWEGYHEHITS